MSKINFSLFTLLASLFLVFSSSTVLAGGGLIEWTKLDAWNGASFVNPGEPYIVKAKVHKNNEGELCKNCPIKIKFTDPRADDLFNQTSDKTDENGEVEAKVISYARGVRYMYAEATIDGNLYTGSQAVLYFTGSGGTTSYQPSAPEMIYPQNGQTLDLEGAYMFKVGPVDGSTGYLFGLFQDGQMIYENYRDNKSLSSNGEFALWDNNPYHAKFHEGEVKVMIRALVNNQWTDAREIYINLKSRAHQIAATLPRPQVYNQPTVHPTITVTPPPVSKAQQVVIVTDSSASAALQNKVDELQRKLEESQHKQSVLEERLTQVIHWIKSIFPFFK